MLRFLSTKQTLKKHPVSSPRAPTIPSVSRNIPLQYTLPNNCATNNSVTNRCLYMRRLSQHKRFMVKQCLSPNPQLSLCFSYSITEKTHNRSHAFIIVISCTALSISSQQQLKQLRNRLNA